MALHYFVDNEAKQGRINCMTIQPYTTKNVLVFYGHDVHFDQFEIYRRLTSLDVKTYAWSDGFEKRYPNLVDL